MSVAARASRTSPSAPSAASRRAASMRSVAGWMTQKSGSRRRGRREHVARAPDRAERREHVLPARRLGRRRRRRRERGRVRLHEARDARRAQHLVRREAAPPASGQLQLQPADGARSRWPAAAPPTTPTRPASDAAAADDDGARRARQRRRAVAVVGAGAVHEALAPEVLETSSACSRLAPQPAASSAAAPCRRAPSGRPSRRAPTVRLAVEALERLLEPRVRVARRKLGAAGSERTAAREHARAGATYGLGSRFHGARSSPCAAERARAPTPTRRHAHEGPRRA